MVWTLDPQCQLFHSTDLLLLQGTTCQCGCPFRHSSQTPADLYLCWSSSDMRSLLLPIQLEHVSWHIFTLAGRKRQKLQTKLTDWMSGCPCIPFHIHLPLSPPNLQLLPSWFPITFSYQFFTLVAALNSIPSRDIIWNYAMQQSAQNLKSIESVGLREGIFIPEGILDIIQQLFHPLPLLCIL